MVTAIGTTLVISIIFILLFVEAAEASFDPPEYLNPSLSSFFLGFATILFGFGGASVFPTIQNDMRDRSQFWRGVTIAFVSEYIFNAYAIIFLFLFTL